MLQDFSGNILQRLRCGFVSLSVCGCTLMYSIIAGVIVPMPV